ncbi:hypothetical protein K8Q94_00925 [Candidatus Nomurabacteria bacterium]|nr:hypothetical protein [Candidatus Nomurabacteria bacterium]
MIKEKVLDSITILANGDVPEVMKKSLAESQTDLTPLCDTTIIQAENISHGGYLQEHYGIDMALQILAKEPNRKIILYSPLTLENLRKRKEKLELILAKPNARFLEMPFSIKTLVSAFQAEVTEMDAEKTAIALTNHVKGALSGIFHNIRKAKNPLQPEGQWQTEIVAKGFATAKEIFPMLADKDNASILSFLEEISADREEIRKGEELTGIFCDMEGTLFANGILNNALLTFLHQQEIESKIITLWTDGNIAELQTMLDANGITWQLKAKRDFAGAIVEMAIDDMDENSFTGLTKIFAKRFRPIQEFSA